jgi:hypothetical protein
MTTIAQQNEDLANGYNFQVFDIVKALNDRRNFAMTITSKRNTGKSVLLKDLCYQIKNWYQEVFVFSLTAHLQPDLFDFIKKENVINAFDEDRIKQIWETQEKVVMKLKKMEIEPDKIPKVLLLFDDLIADPRVKKSDILNRLFIAGRHVHFAQIFITQTFKGIPPTIRTNVDIAVAFYLNSYDDRDEFSGQYLSTKSKKLGMNIFDRITKEAYKAIIVLNFNISSNPEDYVNTYVAKLKVPKFKMIVKKGEFASDFFLCDNLPINVQNGNIFG